MPAINNDHWLIGGYEGILGIGMKHKRAGSEKMSRPQCNAVF